MELEARAVDLGTGCEGEARGAELAVLLRGRYLAEGHDLAGEIEELAEPLRTADGDLVGALAELERLLLGRKALPSTGGDSCWDIDRDGYKGVTRNHGSLREHDTPRK